jgi:hypothetical protein
MTVPQVPSGDGSFSPTSYDNLSPTFKATNTPSDIPSSRPSSQRLNCPEGDLSFVLYLSTDNFPQETEWTLVGVNGTQLLTGGPYDQANTEYIESNCIPNDVYEFSIKDKYGDGLCCDNGQGSYKVLLDGQVLSSGGAFKKIEHTSIVGSCPIGKSRVVVTINTDYFGSETSWTLTGVGSSTVVLNDGNYGEWENRKTSACVDTLDCYQFTIEDSCKFEY